MLLKNKLLNRAGAACFLLLVIIPFVAGIIYSMLYALGLTGILSKGFTTEHLGRVFENGEVFRSLAYSFYIAFTGIFIALVIAMPAVLLFKAAVTKSKWSFFSYLPLALPAIVTAFFSFQLLGKSGVLSRAAFRVNVINSIQQFPDLINDPYSIGIIVTHVLMATPFFLIFFSNVYQSEKIEELTKVSASLGASITQTALKIAMPVLLKKGRITILLYFIFVFGSYEIPLILGQQSPQMISVLIVRKMQRFNLLDIPQGYFLSLIYTITVIALLLIFLKPSKKGIIWGD